MPIEITGPDGTVNRFPDGTPDDAIEKAMRQQYGGPQTPPEATPEPETPSQPKAPAFDWANVKTSDDVQKVLDAQPTSAGKKAALQDWAKYRVNQEAKVLPPMLSGATYVPGTGLIDLLSAGVSAGVNSLTGGKHGNPFDQERALQKARHNYAWENASLPSKVASVGGGLVAGTRLPIIKALSEGNIFTRTGNAALTGAAYGAEQGAGQADTAGDIIPDAATGLVTGGAFGTVANPLAEGAGNIVKHAVNGVRRLPADLQGTSRGAVKRVARAVADDDLPANYPQQARDLGAEGMLADMGPNLRDQAGAIANRPGAGQTTLRNALDRRNEGAPARMESAVTGAFGPAENLVRLREQTVDAANRAATPHYQAFERAEIPMTDELHHILREADAWGALRDARQKAAGQSLQLRAINRLEPDPMGAITGRSQLVTDLVPTGRELDYVKRALDAKAQKAFENGDTHQGTLINNTARRLTNEIDNILSPGNPAGSPYAQARGEAATGKQFEEGLDEGGRIFSNPRTHHPDQVEFDLHNATPEYGAGYRAGARADLARMADDSATQFGATGDRALRKGMFSTNAERKIDQLASSPDTARELLRVRDAESTFADTRNAVTSNSATARRQAAQKEFPAPLERDVLGNFSTTLTGLGLGAIRTIANAATLGRYNEHLARMADNAARLLSASGADRDRYFAALQNYIASRGVTEAQAKAITNAVRRLAVAASGPAGRKVAEINHPDLAKVLARQPIRKQVPENNLIRAMADRPTTGGQ